MERQLELNGRYPSENIWNMDESNCFFKAPPDKGLVEKGKQAIKIHDCLFFLMLPGKKSKSQLLYGRVECHAVLED